MFIFSEPVLLRRNSFSGGEPFVRYFRVTAYCGDEVKVVNVPAFADSISEGDVRWEKGEK